VDILVPLDRLGNNRDQLLTAINGLEAGGDTALLDGVARAHKQLVQLNDAERINAIVVMTDGQENSSHISIVDLQSQLRRGNEVGAPVVIFAIAYGGDADHFMLEQIAEPTGGQVRQGTVETIRELYKILSTYF
jgi:Ca-activated chloride channel family protein